MTGGGVWCIDGHDTQRSGVSGKKQGIAVRAYGGALICDSHTPCVEPSVEDKSALNTAIKRQIASAAAELIKPGHRIILDSGTTTCEIARQLRQHSDVIAMTNGMNVANALLEAEGVELLMTGAPASPVAVILWRSG